MHFSMGQAPLLELLSLLSLPFFLFIVNPKYSGILLWSGMYRDLLFHFINDVW